MKEYTVKLNVGEYGVSILLQAHGKKDFFIQQLYRFVLSTRQWLHLINFGNCCRPNVFDILLHVYYDLKHLENYKIG